MFEEKKMNFQEIFSEYLFNQTKMQTFLEISVNFHWLELVWYVCVLSLASQILILVRALGILYFSSPCQ